MNNRITGFSIFTLLAVILAVLSFPGCSLDYNESAIADSLAEEVPDTVLYDFVQTKVTNGLPEIRVYGAEAAAYGKKKQTLIREVLFQEFNKEGELVTEGSADNIVFFTETEDAEIRGSIDFYSKTEKAGIKGEYLYWKNKEKTLSSLPDEPVRMEKDDGSYILGSGFETQVKQKSVTFTRTVQGQWVDEED
ncbi:MAG: LPS export ABC transporter periplasmic protein LptC [Spirochaetales bacterium]|nr:MAG: LPS export ABC transporter periplasmic protein LptC [Spirochaetales bacterium]